MNMTDDPIVVAVNVASAANVRRTLLALCADERLRQYTLDFLYRIEPRLGAEERRQEEWRQEEWRQEELRCRELRNRWRPIMRKADEDKAKWRNKIKAQKRADKAKEMRNGTNAVRSSDNITASNPSNTSTIVTITTETHYCQYRDHGQPPTYPERHRLFYDSRVNPQHSTTRQAPTQTIPGDNLPRNSAPVNKRKAPPTLAVCVQCEEAFDTADNNDSTACQHHDGDLEYDEESNFWCDYYDGPSRYSEEAKELYPGGFIYSCCGKDGEQDGCKVGRHAASWTRTKRGY